MAVQLMYMMLARSILARQPQISRLSELSDKFGNTLWKTHWYNPLFGRTGNDCEASPDLQKHPTIVMARMMLKNGILLLSTPGRKSKFSDSDGVRFLRKRKCSAGEAIHLLTQLDRRSGKSSLLYHLIFKDFGLDENKRMMEKMVLI